MALFQSTLVLLLLSLLLLQMSRRLKVPYPTMLALAGACFAALPWAPSMTLDPHLALALFIAPALLDAAYDMPPRELRREWRPLLALALFAVILTTAAVAWVGWAVAGIPLAAAVTLGAIVAPPDAAAATAVLRPFAIPRRTLSILEGESLLNDAVALLIFGAAVSAATSTSGTITRAIPQLLMAAPGGLLLGLAMAKLLLVLAKWLAGTMGAILLQLVTTFGTWVLADWLHLSPILAVVALAMMVARHAPSLQTPRDRVQSYAVWGALVFVLNVLAFLLMGLQARSIVSRLEGAAFSRALGFAGLVLVVTLVVRVVWVMTIAALLRGPKRSALIVSWCGMRGLLTLATAFALPATFPERDLIVLCAFTVVIGTLVLQGLTIAPLLHLTRIEPDLSLEREISLGRTAMIDAAVATLDGRSDAAADAVRSQLQAAREVARDPCAPQAATEFDRLRMDAIVAERAALARLRSEGRIADDAFHRLEEELDWSELDAAPQGSFQLEDT